MRSTTVNSKQQMVNILESFWPPNKAKGLLAQTVFDAEIGGGGFGSDASEKVFQGCWLLAPKGTDFYKFRFCFFIHPAVQRADEHIDLRSLLGDKYRPFHAIAEFMGNAGMGVVYAVPQTTNGKLNLSHIAERNFEDIDWKLCSLQNGNVVQRDAREFFGRWAGERGRAGFGRRWDPTVKNKFNALSKNILEELTLNELFYTGFVKSVMKKPVNDPYDVDSLMLSLSQRHIFPMEIKEKFPWGNGTDKFFGIDAGRVMMLLRLCLPNDSNAIYLIREVGEQGNFVGWKYMTLSDVVMTASWNLQAGGLGMGGQQTQTIRLPYRDFKPFDRETFDEENLKTLGNMPKDIKTVAKQFGRELSAKFHQ